MSAMLRSGLNKPAFLYKQSFVPSELEKVKLISPFDDGTTHQSKVPMFSGKEGVECLLYVRERFDAACRQLQLIEGHELCDNFEKVLADNAEQKWHNLTVAINGAQRTPNCFGQEWDRLLLSYTNAHSRDHMYSYLRSTGVRKPHDVEVGDHFERLEAMCRRAGNLQGTNPELTDDQVKEILFDSLPEKWRISFNRSGRDYDATTVPEILQFMQNEKLYADANEEERKRRNSSQGRMINKRGRGNAGAYQGSYPNGFQNNYSGGRFSNFRGGPSRFSGRSGGRGFGRGFGGRGFQRRGYNDGRGYNGGNYNNGGSYNNGGNYGGRGQNFHRGGMNRGGNPGGRHQFQGRGQPSHNFHFQSQQSRQGRGSNQNTRQQQQQQPAEVHHYDYMGPSDNYEHVEEQYYQQPEMFYQQHEEEYNQEYYEGSQQEYNDYFGNGEAPDGVYYG